MPFEEYLSAIVVPLLKQPENFSVSSISDEMGILLSVNVAQGDMGVVIGKAGETAKTIRHLIRVHGMQHHARVNVKIIEPNGSPYRQRVQTEIPIVQTDADLLA